MNIPPIQPTVVLITGASMGIGYATAELLAKEKVMDQFAYKIFATSRNPSEAKQLQALSETHPNISVLALDVRSEESVHQAVQAIFSPQFKNYVVVNNAGIGLFGSPTMHTVQDTQKIFETNLHGVMRVNTAFIARLKKEKLGGQIINMGSVTGLLPSKTMTAYSQSKAALESYTASLAKECQKLNIKVSIILAGFFKTEFETNMEYASGFKEADEESKLAVEQARKGLQAWIQRDGEDPKVAAVAVKKAIEDAIPNHWYPAGKLTENYLTPHYKDLTGNNRIPNF